VERWHSTRTWHWSLKISSLLEASYPFFLSHLGRSSLAGFRAWLDRIESSEFVLVGGSRIRFVLPVDE
jgi:hypothetical protein